MTFPNVVTFVAILCGVFALQQGVWGGEDGFMWAWVVAMIGGALCVSDGLFAEAFRSHSTFGDEILQPVAGLALTAGTVVPLLVHGHWSWWVLALLAVVFGLLQTVDVLNRLFPRVQWLHTAKRHQFYLHPIFSLMVLFIALTWMPLVIFQGKYLAAIIGFGIMVPISLGVLRLDRVAFWLNGPPQ